MVLYFYYIIEMTYNSCFVYGEVVSTFIADNFSCFFFVFASGT